MDTQLVAQSYRIKQWAKAFHDRNEQGLTVKQWCEQNGCTRNQYFYWLRKVREAACQAVGSSFVELTPPQEEALVPADKRTSEVFTPEILLKVGAVTICASSSTSRELLTMAVEVACHAE